MIHMSKIWWIDQEFGTIYIGMYGTNQKVEEWH